MKLRYKKFVATLTSAATALAVVGLVTVANSEVVAPPAQAATSIDESGLKSLDRAGSITPAEYTWNVGSNTLFETPEEAMLQIWGLAGFNTAVVSGMNIPPIVLPVDSMTWNGAIAYGQQSGLQYDNWTGVWSPEGALDIYGVRDFPTNPKALTPSDFSDQSYTNLSYEDATRLMRDGKTYNSYEDVCPQDPPENLGPENVLWSAWCYGPMQYSVTITDPTQTDFETAPLPFGNNFTLGRSPEFTELYPSGPLIGGPAHESPAGSQYGIFFEGGNYFVSIAPRLEVKKQVCVTYDNDGNPTCQNNDSDPGWVEDTTYGDKADPDNPDQVLSGVTTAGGVEEGVEEGLVPPDTTNLLWRVTALNTGNVPLTGIHAAADQVTFQPATDETHDNTCDTLTFDSTYYTNSEGVDLPLGVGESLDPDDPVNVFAQYVSGRTVDDSGALMPGDTLSQMCTTHLDEPFTGIVQNTIGLNASFDNPDAPNYLDPDAYNQFDKTTGQITYTDNLMNTTTSENLMNRFNGYGDDAQGLVPSNLDSAQVKVPEPLLKTTKWVCGHYDLTTGQSDCVIPDAGSDALKQMAGIGEQNANGTWTVTEGTAPTDGPYAGWVKAATVPYESTAQFLIIITNIGNTGMKDVTFDTEDITGFGDNPPPDWPGDWTAYPDPAGPGILQSGDSATFTITAGPIINTNDAGCFYGEDGCPADVPDGYYDHTSATESTADETVDVTLEAQGERPYAAGEDVANTVVATGTPVDSNGKDIPGRHHHVYSNPSTAEVRATPANPALKLTKWVCYTGTGCDLNLNDKQIASLTGYTPGAVVANQSIQGDLTGESTGGWVPETYVPYNTAADWLLIAVNIGNATLSMDDPADSIATGSDLHGDTTDPVPVPGLDQSETKTVDGANVTLLKPGDHIVYTLSTKAITSMAKNDGDVKDGEWTMNPWNEQDRVNDPGSVINEASITGTVWDVVNDRPLKDPNSDVDTPWVVPSNVSNAEVNSIALAIGDYVWYDTDGTGIQPDDPADARPGVPNVRVDLLYEDGTPVLDSEGNAIWKTTDPNGFYYFDMLTPGTYRVAFSLPAGYAWTTPLATGGEGIDSIARDSDAIHPISDDNDLVRVSDAIDMNVSTLLDYANHDHVFKVEDAAMPNVYKSIIDAEFINPTVDAGIIQLTPNLKVTKWVCALPDNACAAPSAPADPDNPDGPTVLSTLAGYNTDQGEIAGAPAGGWAKEATVPVGTDAHWLIVVTNTGQTLLHNVTLDDDLASTDVDEANGHGASSAAVPYPASVDPETQQVNLRIGQSAAFTLTTHDITNSFDVKEGIDEDGVVSHAEPTYFTGDSSVINKVTASGEPWGINPQTKAPEPIKDPATGKPVGTVKSNESSAEVNSIGYAIGDYMWIDTNENGQQDADENPIPGMTVTLYSIVDGQQVGTPRTATTNEQGLYLFDNLPAGQYQVVFPLPDGYVWTSTHNPDAGPTLDSDADQVTGQSQIITLGVDAEGVPVDSNIVPGSEATYSVNAKWINPTIDAGVYVVPAPDIQLRKYICKEGTGCQVPEDLSVFYNPQTGWATEDPVAGHWAKETTVLYDAPADWLVVIANTGNVDLADVNIFDEDLTGGGYTDDCLFDEDTPITALLPVGAATIYQCTINHVTNTNAFDSGKEIVNNAEAIGTPVEPGPPKPPIHSNRDHARVRTTPPPSNPPTSETPTNPPTTETPTTNPPTTNPPTTNPPTTNPPTTNPPNNPTTPPPSETTTPPPSETTTPPPSESTTPPNNPPTSPNNPPTSPSNPPTSPENPPTSPSNPPTSPENPPTSPENPPTSPSNPPTSPENPPTSPSNPPTSPENPPTSPSNPPTSPENPPTSPENPPTSPSNPPTSPSNPPTSPENPPTSPENPPTSPENPPTSPSMPPSSPAPSSPTTPPPVSGVGTGGSAQLPSQNGWAIPLFLLGAVIGVGALVTRKHLS